jgi:hypothetical protein
MLPLGSPRRFARLKTAELAVMDDVHFGEAVKTTVAMMCRRFADDATPRSMLALLNMLAEIGPRFVLGLPALGLKGEDERGWILSVCQTALPDGIPLPRLPADPPRWLVEARTPSGKLVPNVRPGFDDWWTWARFSWILSRRAEGRLAPEQIAGSLRGLAVLVLEQAGSDLEARIACACVLMVVVRLVGMNAGQFRTALTDVVDGQVRCGDWELVFEQVDFQGDEDGPGMVSRDVTIARASQMIEEMDTLTRATGLSIRYENIDGVMVPTRMGMRGER